MGQIVPKSLHGLNTGRLSSKFATKVRVTGFLGENLCVVTGSGTIANGEAVAG